MNNGPVMYGNLIVEGSGFGMNYEGIDFTPPYYQTCHDELWNRSIQYRRKKGRGAVGIPRGYDLRGD